MSGMLGRINITRLVSVFIQEAELQLTLAAMPVTTI